MNRSQILKLLLVKVTLPQKKSGSGVLWKAGWLNGCYMVFTCKHNLCHSPEKCKIKCSNECEYLNGLSPEEVEVLDVNQEILEVEKLMVSEHRDFAILLIKRAKVDTVDSLFENGHCKIAKWQDDFLDEMVYFAGFPAIFYKQNNPDHHFKGDVSYINEKTYHFEIREGSSRDIKDVRGVSGSGIFRYTPNKQLVLLGIISEYKRLTTYKGIYFQDILNRWFPDLEYPDICKNISTEEASLTKEAERIVSVNKIKELLNSTEEKINTIASKLEGESLSPHKEKWLNQLTLLKKVYLDNIQLLHQMLNNE